MNNDWYNEAQPHETRRRFLKKLGQAGAVTMLGGAPRAMASDAKGIDHPKPTADACILL